MVSSLKPSLSNIKTAPTTSISRWFFMNIWENQVTINSGITKSFTPLPPASFHADSSRDLPRWAELGYHEFLAEDIFPIPETCDREGYYACDHFGYWASGLRDAKILIDRARAYNIIPQVICDIGCASGRVIRHLPLLIPGATIYGCDINRLHVEFCNKFLHPSITTFQNCSIPYVQLESNSVDVVTAYSVFTHVEAMETAWLMEIKRILRPGGLAWITLHTEHTLKVMKEEWPLWVSIMNHPKINELINVNERTFEGDRVVIRWNQQSSYSSNVFYKEQYINTHWGRIMDIVDTKYCFPDYQDVFLLRKSQ